MEVPSNTWWGTKKTTELPIASSEVESPGVSHIWSDIAAPKSADARSTFLTLPTITLTQKSRSKCITWVLVISILVAVAGFTVGAVGIARWQSLKKEVDRLHNEVEHFAELNQDLQRTNEDLKNTNAALEFQVNRLDTEITKFAELSDSIRRFVNKTSAAFDEVLDQANSLFFNITDRLNQMDDINKSTQEALALQLASEKRERYTAYVSMAATTELADGRSGFTPSEWDIFADRVTMQQRHGGNLDAKAQFLARFPFSTLSGGGQTIHYEVVFNNVIPNIDA